MRFLRVDDFQHVERGDVAKRSVSPCRDEGGAEVALGNLAAPLLRQLVRDEGFRRVAEGMPQAGRPLTRCLGNGFRLDHGGVDALVDQAAPFACGAPRLVERDRAIDADDAAGRCRIGSEAGVQDEGDATGLAAPRRVGILAVADADAEAGNAGVEHFDALAARCGPQRSEETVGYQSMVGHRWSCSGLGLRVGYMDFALAGRMPANVCARL